ncbi:hypothetical protein ACHAXT_001513 [Thalassiosira profunda]
MSISTPQEATTAAVGGPEKAHGPPQIDLATCAPEELAAWLLSHRFEDNAVDVASFLLNCTSTLPNAEQISAQLMGGGGDDEEEDEEMEEAESKGGEAVAAEVVEQPSADPQTALWRIQSSEPQPAFANQSNNQIEVSCTNPRGKFALSMHKGGIVLTNPKKSDEEQIPIAPGNVQNVVWFRKPEDYKKLKSQSNGGKKKGIPGHMVLICLKEESGGEGAGIQFRNKALGQVCFQLPTYPAPTDEGEDNVGLTEEDWWNGLSSALFSGGKGGIVRVHASVDAAEHAKGKSGFMFRSEGESGSSSTTEGMPYVGCYQGFNDGALFPLREGLLFFKPPLFLPRSKLASISCGRGSGGSRYVDMMVQLDVSDVDEQEGGKKKKQVDSLEFTNIHRDELNGLNDYIHKTLIPAMQADADEDSDDEEIAVAEVVNSDSEEGGGSDESESEEEGSGKKRRSSRAASKSAREINKAALTSGAEGDDDSDDDDSDAFEEEDATDGSDEDESVMGDGESDASSDDADFEEEEEESDESDDEEDGHKSKKTRVD